MEGPAPVMLKWALSKNPATFKKNEIIPQEVVYFCDPSPILPPLREICMLTLPSLSLTLEGWSNQLKILRTAFEYQQVFIIAKSETKIGRESRLSRICIDCEDYRLYSLNSGKVIDIRERVHWDERERLLSTPPVPKFMSTLAWNTRGISRPSFMGNLSH